MLIPAASAYAGQDFRNPWRSEHPGADWSRSRDGRAPVVSSAPAALLVGPGDARVGSRRAIPTMRRRSGSGTGRAEGRPCNRARRRPSGDVRSRRRNRSWGPCRAGPEVSVKHASKKLARRASGRACICRWPRIRAHERQCRPGRLDQPVGCPGLRPPGSRRPCSEPASGCGGGQPASFGDADCPIGL
jgi:hypothetical protein